MNKKIIIFTFILLIIKIINAFSQSGRIEGKIVDENTNEPLPFAIIMIDGTNIGSTSDMDGKFIFTGLKPGYVRLSAQTLGHEKKITEDFLVTNAKTVFVEIQLKPKLLELKEVVVTSGSAKKTLESPVSMRTIGIFEIEKNPGANRDISKVVQNFPGVVSTPAFRNDLIVRGGGASENRFYLDGIEIPNINHFATQGSSGGPVGMINVDFIRQVDFYSGAFPAKLGNALSSIIDFKQIDGNNKKARFRATIGASDLALTADGPLGDKTTYILSVRRSYLQLLFNVLGLPFLPDYNDYQLKTKIKFNSKNELIILSLGALDNSELNTGIKNPDESQQYILSYLPVYKQWNYTIGANYKHYKKNGYESFILSRNMLNNISYKYLRNDESSPSNKTLDYKSQEIENKVKYENNLTVGSYNLVLGGGIEYAKYNNNTFQKIYINNNLKELRYQSDLDLFKWHLFGQSNRSFFNETLNTSFGFRMDANSYSKSMSNLLTQFSPRLSLSYKIAPKYFINFNAGRYYQMPSYTTLGYADSLGTLVNRRNTLRYINADHFVAGLEYNRNGNSRITLEGFYKLYHHYPFSVSDSVSLANKGTDFGTYGDEEVTSESRGRSYGMELLYKDADLFGFNVLMSYTYVRSEFEGRDRKFVPSAWDNKHIFNIAVRRSLKNNWDIGIKWKYLGGGTYTPYDVEKSSLRQAYDAIGRAYPDYSKFNTERYPAYHQLDLRIDKGFYFKKWSLMLYIDIQNLYNAKTVGADFLVNYDKNGNIMIDPSDNSKYILRKIPNSGGTILPTIGIMIEF